MARKAKEKQKMARKAKEKQKAEEEETPTMITPAGGGSVNPTGPLKLPHQLRPAPLGPPTIDYRSATLATIPTIAAVTSSPAQSLITAKTGRQLGSGPHVFGPGSRTAVRVVRY
jgi:hypothetical protein